MAHEPDPISETSGASQGTAAAAKRAREKVSDVTDSIREKANELSQQAQAIIRSELRLARAELNEQIAALKRISRTALPAFVLGLYAIGFLLLASVYALELVLPAWLSALVVAVGVGGVAGILLGTAYRQ